MLDALNVITFAGIPLHQHRAYCTEPIHGSRLVRSGLSRWSQALSEQRRAPGRREGGAAASMSVSNRRSRRREPARDSEEGRTSVLCRNMRRCVCVVAVAPSPEVSRRPDRHWLLHGPSSFRWLQVFRHRYKFFSRHNLPVPSDTHNPVNLPSIRRIPSSSPAQSKQVLHNGERRCQPG